MRLGLLTLGAWLVTLAFAGAHRGGYDCALAVWHPDYPKAVREACRRFK